MEFSRLCKLWNLKLKGGKPHNPPKLDISMYKSCIVGEAHGFPDVKTGEQALAGYHGCNRCVGFAEAMYEVSRHSKRIWSEEITLGEVVDIFMTHWNEDHGPETRYV